MIDSHLCEALGQAAVGAGMTVAWFTIEDLGVMVRRYSPTTRSPGR